MKLSNFEVIKSIGQGGFGNVFIARSKRDFDGIAENQVVCIKVINKKHEFSIKREIETLKAVKNLKFLSQMLGGFQDRTGAFLVLRFEQNGSLLDVMNRMSVVQLDFARNVIVEVCIALKFLHERKIIHGDMKPENVLLDQNLRVRVADFGLSVATNDRGYVGQWGTPTYQSPEMLTDNELWDHRIDYFNSGIIFVMMISGTHPFTKHAQNDKQVHDNIRLLKYKKPRINCTNAQSFISRTLCYQNERLKYDDVLEHPFIKPMVAKLMSIAGPDCTLFLTEKQETMYVNNKNFFNPISGLDFEGELWDAKDGRIETTANVEAEINVEAEVNVEATTARNEQHEPAPNSNPDPAIIEKIQKQLFKLPNACGATILKMGHNDYRIKCNKCDKRIKVVGQPRGKKGNINWTTQVYGRQLARH